MKKKTFLISIILISTFLSFAQFSWEKHENNPVMQVQYGTWYSWNVFFPVVIHHDGIYKMWFCGNNSSTNRHIGYAESPDGIEWEIWNDPVISGGEPGSWALHVYPGSVININDTLRMWFTGSTNSVDNGSIGSAWSVVGNVWHINPDPVLEAGASGTWDDIFVFHPGVYFDGMKYHMYYMGGDSWRIGYATSFDGISWEKDYDHSPVLALGPSGSFYEEGAIDADIIMINDTLRMYFTGSDGTSSYPPWYSYWRIGYAWSTDYINWNIHPEPAVDVGVTGAWDESIVAGPSVLIHDGHYKMWYWGDHYNANWEIGYACGDNAIIRVPAQQPTIQAGIDAACNGSIVLVDDGTYYENINFKGKSITVASQFLMDGDTNHINNTTIDGSQYTNPDSASVVIFCSGEDTTSILQGFTITGGAGTYLDDWNDYDGGGIFISNAGAKILNNKIIDNIVENPLGAIGGGIATNLQAEQYWVVIEDNYVANNQCLAVDNYASGGGIYVGINGRVNNNIIANNYCKCQNETASAGGFFGSCQTTYTHTIEFVNNTIINNEVEGNYFGGYYSGSGGLSFHTTDAIIKNNIINGNIVTSPNEFALGGAMYFNTPNNYFHIINNIISDNYSNSELHGGGIYLYNTGTKEVLIDGNLINNNQATIGGGIYAKASYNVILTNNVFNGNIVEHNGGALAFKYTLDDYIPALADRSKSAVIPEFSINLDNQNPNIINNTFVNNIANNFGGVLFSDYSWFPVIINSIFWENEAEIGPDIYNNYAADIPVYYSDIDTSLIHGYWSGENNIFVDPEFNEDGYHLLQSSLCIDAGIDSIIIGEDTFHCPEFDVDGELRPFNDIVDIGADEFYPQTWIQESKFANNHHLLQNYPNPFTGYTTIKFELESDCFTEISIYDLTGKKVQTILCNHIKTGKHKIEFDADRLHNGIYFYQLKTDNKIAGTRKMIVLN